MNAEYFPTEVAVLSQDALRDYIQAEYFTPNTSLICRLFYRGIHDIYRIITDNQVYFYKIYRQDIRKLNEIQSEIDLLNHLKTCGIQAVCPVPKKDTSCIGQFQTVTGTRYGVLYTSVGQHDFDEMEETTELNEALGKYIASIHTAWDTYTFECNRWHINSHSFIDDSMDAIRCFREIHDFDIGFLEEVAKETKEKLINLNTTKPEYGICHGDIYGGNIRMDAENNPVLFDFDFCGSGWRAYDISLYAFNFGLGCDAERLKKRERRLYDFLNGYNKVRAMADSEIRSIPLFIPFRRIFNIGTLYITYLHNTWGDCAVIRNVDEDIINLRKWLELNPVL